MKNTATKKIILMAVVLLTALVPGLIWQGQAAAAVYPPSDNGRKGTLGIGELFSDEELTYQIGVLVFDDAATGTLSLRKSDDGDYVATLTAHTVGVIDRFYHRKDTYVSILRQVDNGRRFITRAFVKTVDINGRIREGVTVMDYDNKLMTWKSWGGGKDEKGGAVKLNDGAYYDDPLAAFYNFRYGAYGPLRAGKVYRIPTFPKEDHVPEISLRIAPLYEFQTRTNGKKPFADYLADVKLDRELFGSGSGEIEILFTEGLIPVEAVAKDVVFFGDVRGRLKGLGLPMGFSKKTPAPADGVVQER